METSLPVAERPRRPAWMKVRAPSADSRYFDVRKLIHGASLNTVCEEARCPNIAECWGRAPRRSRSSATRAPARAATATSTPASRSPPDPLEPLRLPRRRRRWACSTSSSRRSTATTSPDRGAGHFAATIRALKAKLPDCSVEVLTPDFLGVEEQALATVLGARPDVFSHNIETVRRLHRRMRGAKASYDGRSSSSAAPRRSPTIRC